MAVHAVSPHLDLVPRRPRISFAPRTMVERTAVVLPRSFADWGLFGAVLWFGSYLYLYAYGVGGPKPLISYFALLGATGLWLVGRVALTGRGPAVFDVWMKRFLIWCAIYFCYVAFSTSMLLLGYAPAEPLVLAWHFVSLTTAMLLLMADPRRLALAAQGFALLALAAVALNLYDFVIPTFSTVPGRAAGLYGNPTIAGNMIAMSMVAGLAAVPMRLRLPFMVACGIGVLVTFSRESWLAWAVAFVWVAHQGQVGGTGRLRLRTLVGLVIGGGVAVFVFTGGLGQLLQDTHLRTYLNANTLQRIGISSSVLSDESARERQYLITRSLEEASEAPVFGKGFGYTQSPEWGVMVRPHNTFLMMFVEGGVFALAIYAGLVVLLWQSSVGLGRVVVGLFIVTSFFSHNQLEQPALMLLVAFALAHGAIARESLRGAEVSGRAARFAGIALPVTRVTSAPSVTGGAAT